MRLHEVKLKRSKGPHGETVNGLWEGDIVQLEAVDGGWEFRVPVRRIGETNFFEFRSVALGGKWLVAGVVRTRDHACIEAERMQAGTHVLRGAYRDSEGEVPRAVVAWTDVAAEIAEHPSVRPAD
jgi:hypothetical protein